MNATSVSAVSTLPAWPAFVSRVVPVVVIDDARTAVPLAQALLEGGIDVIEITLRSDAALAAIEAVARAVPAMHLGAGTVTRASVRFFGSMVVSLSWEAIISPRPLNRPISVFLPLKVVARSSSRWASSRAYSDSGPALMR